MNIYIYHMLLFWMDNGIQRKRYFKCKKKHGKIEKASYFTAVKGGKGKRKSVASIKNKKGKGKSKGKTLTPIADDDEEEKEEETPKKGKKAKSPAPPPVETRDFAIQTDLRYAPTEMFQYVGMLSLRFCDLHHCHLHDLTHI